MFCGVSDATRPAVPTVDVAAAAAAVAVLAHAYTRCVRAAVRKL